MILLIGSQKGGCAKSTLATNISVQLKKLGKKSVILIDADAQKTTSTWANDREELNVEEISAIEKTGNIKKTILEINEKYEYVIIDTAGHDSKELRTGLLAADIFITPFAASQAELDTLPKLWETVEEAMDFNEKLKVFGIFSRVNTNPSVKSVEEAKEFLIDLPKLQILKSMTFNRKIYEDALTEGLGVVEMDNKKAKSEIESIVKELLNYAEA